MAGSPTITIKVGGVPITPASGVTEPSTLTEDGLFMLYVQACKDNARNQFIVFPPAVQSLAHKTDPACLLLRRTQSFPGNRSKWFTHRVPSPAQLAARVMDSGEGWEYDVSVVVPLEADDYRMVWEGKTPHKAIRAIDRALRGEYGTSINGKDD